jgi:hypothetical protein
MDVWNRKADIAGGGDFAPSVQWWKEVEETGQFNRTVVSVEGVDAASGAVKLIFDNAEQLTAWFDHHPDAKYKTAKPDGVRCVNAMGRYLEIEDGTFGEIVLKMKEATSAGPVQFSIENTDQGRLWTFS